MVGLWLHVELLHPGTSGKPYDWCTMAFVHTEMEVGPVSQCQTCPNPTVSHPVALHNPRGRLGPEVCMVSNLVFYALSTRYI